jgi:hypothetical protein
MLQFFVQGNTVFFRVLYLHDNYLWCVCVCVCLVLSYKYNVQNQKPCYVTE